MKAYDEDSPDNSRPSPMYAQIPTNVMCVDIAHTAAGCECSILHLSDLSQLDCSPSLVL